MREGHDHTDEELVRHAFKAKFDAKGARLRAIAEWLLVCPSCFSPPCRHSRERAAL